MKKKTVIIVDNNPTMIESLSSIIRRDNRFEIIGKATNGLDAYELLNKSKPDVVLMDIVLPKVDGLTIIEEYKKSHKDASKNPKFIIVSAVGRDVITTSAFDIGVVSYIMKPFDKLSVLNTIRMACGFRRIYDDEFDDIKLDELIIDAIDKILIDIGIQSKYSGYKYLRDGIALAVKDPEIVGSVTKLLYPEIAKMNDTTASRVERSIRNAIEQTWEKSLRVHKMFEYMENSIKKRPTNSEFIAIIADKIRLDLKTLENK